MSLDYAFQQLPGADFRDKDLRGASFRYAYLHKADFRGANLEEADFWGADLREARFDGCEDEPIDRLSFPQMMRASILHADVTGTIFDIELGYDENIEDLLRLEIFHCIKDYQAPEPEDFDDDDDIEDLKAEIRALRRENIQLKKLVYKL